MTTKVSFHPYRNDIITQITKPMTKFKKWLTFSEIPSRIFSMSLQIKNHVNYEFLVATSILFSLIFTIKKKANKRKNYSLGNSNSKIVICTRHIVPADFLFHKRFKISDANACDLSQSRVIETVNANNSSNKLHHRDQRQQYTIWYRVIDNFVARFFGRCIRSAKFQKQKNLCHFSTEFNLILCLFILYLTIFFHHRINAALWFLSLFRYRMSYQLTKL